VFLAGEVARDPETTFTDGGTQVCSIAIKRVEERDGKEDKTFVPVAARGKSAEIVGELSQGDAVLVRGK
jgi:single-stranded DNA-binding protein